MKQINRLFILGLLITLITSDSAHGQFKIESGFRTDASIAGGNNPFWFHSNKFGLYDPASSNAFSSIYIKKELSDTKFDYAFSADAIARYSENENVFFHEIYGEVKYGIFNLWAGKKEWIDTWYSEDNPLSVGSLVWSGNAPTMPKIMLESDWLDVPLTNNFVGFRGYLGHGWFENDRYTKNVYLHEKALYIRLLPEDFPFYAQAGVIHNVQWGGSNNRRGNLPSSFTDFIDVFLGRGSSSQSAPAGEVSNKLGNIVGAFDFSGILKLESTEYRLYRQFYLESQSSPNFRSAWDGLYGFQVKSMKSQIVSSFLYELTMLWRHDAKIYKGEARGANSYYANGIYRNGWTTENRLIGSPFVLTGPVNGITEITNNILLAHHIGLGGEFELSSNEAPISYNLKATYSRNYGRTSNCPQVNGTEFCDETLPQPLRFPRADQFYSSLELSYPYNNQITLHSSVGLDVGELADNFGLLFGLSYAFKQD